MGRKYSPDQKRKWNKTASTKLKLEVTTVYGGGESKCVLCGEHRLACLSIDHPKGNGAEERRDLKCLSGTHFYRWLKKNNFPPGYRTLCMNCQFITRAENRA
jgi:hypothetical protein